MAIVRKRKQTLDQSMAIIRGNEPIITEENFREQMSRAFTWYNANWDEKDFRKAADQYVIKHLKMKDAAYALSKASFLDIRGIGVVGRLVENQQYVDLDYIARVMTTIEELKTKHVKAKTVPVAAVAAAPVAAPPSVQERMLEAARTIAADVNGAIDAYTVDGTEFSMKSLLVGKQVSGPVAKKVGELFVPTLNELEEAIAGTDPQLKEGYGQYTKRGLKQFAEFIRQIIADCNQQVVSAKAQRKPRARKAKPASVIVKKVAILKEFPELGLKSIAPEKIVGATELWAYNTTTRKLIVFYGADNGFLGVSGKSVTNYDVEKSAVKTLRDPAKFFKGLSSFGKRAMSNAWKAIRAKESKPRSRINEDMILLAAN